MLRRSTAVEIPTETRIAFTFCVLFLLSNMELIELHWHNIWHLWPALLIYLGISALPINNYYKLGFFLVLTSLLIYILIKYPEPLQFNPDVHTI